MLQHRITRRQLLSGIGGTALLSFLGKSNALAQSMPPELVERHGIPFDEVRPVVEAFGRGDVDTALGLVPDAVGERLALAGTPEEWVERIKRDFVPHGYNHIALGLADPFLVERWSGRPAEGLPQLHEQLTLIRERMRTVSR